MFGMVNSLFSGLAFGGVVYTLLIQRKEIDRNVQVQEQSEKAFRDQLKTMNQTLEITALDSLIKSYSSIAAERKGNADEYYRIINQREKLIKSVEQYLHKT